MSVAQERVDRLQAVAKDTTGKLTAGTRRWEADQAALRSVSLQLHNTQRRVQASQRTADEGSERMSALARRLYMSGGQEDFQLAFTQDPDEILGALQVRGALQKVAGSDAEIVRRAKTARLRLGTEERSAQQLIVQAQDLVSGSASRLAGLRALALQTSDRLAAAQADLQGARADKLAKQRARERASRSRQSSGPGCTGKSTSGQSNGNLDPESLCPLWMAQGHRLRSDAAKGFNAMSQHHAAVAGGPLCVTDSYRSYREQTSVYRRKPGLAAVPGSSNHGWGLAVDFCGGVQDSGSAAYDWMKANAGRFGWYHPEWAEPSGSKPEAWHWEYRG